MTAVSRLDEVFKNGSISRSESRCCMLWQVSWLRSLLVCPQLPCRDSGHCFVCRPILLWLPYTLNCLSVKTDLVFISVSPLLAYTRCSVFVDWINEINQWTNEHSMDDECTRGHLCLSFWGQTWAIHPEPVIQLCFRAAPWLLIAGAPSASPITPAQQPALLPLCRRLL